MPTPAPLPLAARVERYLYRAAIWFVPVAAAMTVIAGRTGRPATYLTAAAATVAATTGHGLVLFRRAGVARASGRTALFRSARHTAAGLLVAGGTAAAAIGLALFDPDRAVPASGLAAAGLLVTAWLLASGLLLLLPGAGLDPVARARRALDGVSIGLCLATTRALVLPALPVPAGPSPAVSLLGAMTLWVALPVVGVVVVHALPAGRDAVVSAVGAALVLVGVGLLVEMLTHRTPVPVIALDTLLLTAGPPLVLWGAARDHRSAPVESGQAPGILSRHPLLIIPTVLAAAGAGYRWLVFGTFDHASVALGVLATVAVGLREVLTALDVRRYARQLAEQTAYFRSLVAGSSDVTILLDDSLSVRWQSPSAARQFGLSEQDVLGNPFTALLHPDDAAEVAGRLTALLAEPGPPDIGPPVLLEARLRDGSGRWRDTESAISDQRGVPEVAALVVHLRDVGERKDLERTLHRLAFTDQLTGLPNRRDLLRTVAALRTVPDQPGAVIIIDLDGFTAVNDSRGHQAGDTVLIEVGRRLRASVGDADLAARLGGDEFAVLTPMPPVQAYALAARLLAKISQSLPLGGVVVNLSASAGMADIGCPGGVDEVLRRAELALRRARQLGQGRIEWYDDTVEAAMTRRLTLEGELPGVVDRGELDLVYQPIVELTGGRPVAVEALLRWRHPKLGTVPPSDFIPVAEDLGIIDEIGGWVLRRACRQLSAWRREGRDLWMTVNVSPRQLAGPGFVAAAARALGDSRIPAEHLIVEVAERDLGSTTGAKVVSQLAGLRSLGVRTALDHFGTGPTSLVHLRRLPVDILKIDRALFAEPAGRGGPSAPIVDVMVGLGRRLGLEVVAEGVEAQAHLDSVREAGCRYGQGYLFARPAPAEHVEAYLEHHRFPSL